MSQFRWHLSKEAFKHYLNDKSSKVNIWEKNKSYHNPGRSLQFASETRTLATLREIVRKLHASWPKLSEESVLLQTGQFGEDGPEVLQRTVWWVLSFHFGFESHRLKCGDIGAGKWSSHWQARPCLESWRGSKTQHGDGHHRTFNPRAYASENERCPVRWSSPVIVLRKWRHPPHLSFWP